MFVELTRYSPAVGLHAAVTLRLEFPAAGHAVTALSVRPFPLQRLSAGLSLPLLTSVSAGPAPVVLPAPAPPPRSSPRPAPPTRPSPRPSQSRPVPAGEPAALRAVLLGGRGACVAQGRAYTRGAARGLGAVAAGGTDRGRGARAPDPAGCSRPSVDPLRAPPPAPLY